MRSGNRFKYFIFSILPVVILLFLAEATVRIKYYLTTKEISFLLTPFYSKFGRETRQNILYSQLYKTHRECRKCEKMGWEKEITYTVNKQGFRGKDFHEKKPADIFRIIMIGGSSLYGIYSEDADTIPAVLDRLLNQNLADFPKKFEVINGGQSAMSLMGFAKNTFFYNRISKVLSFSPDLVLFYESINDADMRNYAMIETNSRITQFATQVRIHNLLYYKSMLYTYLLEKYSFNTIKRSLRKLNEFESIYLKEVGKLIEEFENAGIKVVFIKQAYDFPLIYNGISYTDYERIKNILYQLPQKDSDDFRDFKDSYWALKQRYVLNLQEKLAKKYNLLIIDPLVEIEQLQKKSQDLFCDHVHLTDKGNYEVASYIFNRLKPYILSLKESL